MNTVREKLMGAAQTQAERDLIALWMSEERDELCARQRAWQEVQARGSWTRLRFSW